MQFVEVEILLEMFFAGFLKSWMTCDCCLDTFEEFLWCGGDKNWAKERLKAAWMFKWATARGKGNFTWPAVKIFFIKDQDPLNSLQIWLLIPSQSPLSPSAQFPVQKKVIQNSTIP